jgi:predicted fused transcriptional regulator/phosphomethylpyrimidine kinase
MQIYEVTGYEVRKSVIEAERHLGSFIVNINVRRPGDNSVTNQRFLTKFFRSTTGRPYDSTITDTERAPGENRIMA